MKDPVCGEPVDISDESTTLLPLEVPLPTPSAWGRVLLSNGKPCVHRHADFGILVDTVIEPEELSPVTANIHGEFAIPGYAGPLDVHCEGVSVGGDATGTKAVAIDLPGAAPEPGPIVVMPTGGGSAMRPPLGVQRHEQLADAGDKAWGADQQATEELDIIWARGLVSRVARKVQADRIHNAMIRLHRGLRREFHRAGIEEAGDAHPSQQESLARDSGVPGADGVGPGLPGNPTGAPPTQADAPANARSA